MILDENVFVKSVLKLLKFSSSSGFISIGLPTLMVGILFFVHHVSAQLTLPTTPCDSHLMTVPHLTNTMPQEDGTIAFSYGPDNNSFVTTSSTSSTLTFDVKALFVPQNPNAAIKLLAFDSSCNVVLGFGAAFTNIIPLGENFFTYDPATQIVGLNGVYSQQFPGGTPRYVWVEVVDAYPNATKASYSYLVDIQNPQNPSGTIDGSLTRNPLIIVPGIMGTELFDNSKLVWIDPVDILSPSDDFLDVLKMDNQGDSLINTIQPGDMVRAVNVSLAGKNINLFDYSEQLIEDLKSVGYVEDLDLFIFPYDWRMDLEQISVKLDNLIKSKVQNGKKVDIIAHSMGGLVVKKYLQNYGKNDVNSLIFVGAPHIGAPKSAKILIFGDQMLKTLLNFQKIKEISQNMPAVYELLPSQSYFNNFSGYLKNQSSLLDYQNTKTELANVGLNSFLLDEAENFHSSGIDNLDLSGIEAFNINGCNTPTLAAFQVGQPPHRLPAAPQFLQGDGTVPLRSSTFVQVPSQNNYFVKGAKHNTMMTYDSVRKLISAILTGGSYTDSNLTQDVNGCHIKGKVLAVFSPVDVKITDQNGNYTGPNQFSSFDENIPGVAYEVLGEEKFVFLPTDQGQTYDVELDATGLGSFDLKVIDTDDGVSTGTIYYNNVGITNNSAGKLSLSDTSNDSSIMFDYSGSGNFVALSASSVLDQNASDDETPPTTTFSATGIPGQNGWYRSSVDISLSAADDNSGILKTEYSLDGGVTWSNYSGPVNLATEGINNFSFFSTDRAGNRETVQTQTIKIDFTSPEANLQFDPVSKDIIFTGVDNLSPVSSQIVSNVMLFTDEAGNTTNLEFAKHQEKRFIRIDLLLVSYNGQGKEIRKNRFTYNWGTDEAGNLIRLIQIGMFSRGDFVFLVYEFPNGNTVIREKIGTQENKQIKLGLAILNIKINKEGLSYVY